MNFAVLSRDSKLYACMRLLEAAMARGHQARVIDPVRCSISIATGRPSVHYLDEALPAFDAIIPRFGTSITAYGVAVLRQFEWLGTRTLNSAVAISRSRDKLQTLQLLAQQGIPVPQTAYAQHPEAVSHLVTEAGGAPLVMKWVEGMQGTGVMLAESRNAAESTMQALMAMRAEVMTQAFIQEAAGSDVRCFVINGEVVAAMRRQGRAGEFRSNLHCGGFAEIVELTAQERALAEQAAKIIGLDVCGVDLLRSQQGPLVLEVNAAPGIEGIERISGCDIAGLMIRAVEHAVRNK